jgi:hypothetical protein
MGERNGDDQLRRKPMSWSVTAVGKPRAVAAKIAAQFEAIKCYEPEETIKKSVAAALAAALEAYPETTAVNVQASGSQSGKELPVTNSLSVKLETLYGFVE